MSDYIIGLDELGRGSVATAGGKGALLGELLSRGYPVPRGFCIATGAYDDFLKISGIIDQIKALEGIAEETEYVDAAEAIMSAIQEAAIPADLAVGLSTIYRTMGQRPRVAVRSSPAYEAMLRSPITGKTDHFLNVVGERDLFQAVRDIWAGIWDPVVISFCRRRAIDHARLKPAVIIQSMVRPISSGSIFTADPMSGDRDKLLITAGWGMKQESLGGQLAPDTYHVDRGTLTLRFKRIVTKELMVSASGLVPVPKNRRNAVVLKDAAIRDLCQMATGVEDIFGEPAEVEWCVLQGGGFMILEALPVAVGDEILGEDELAPEQDATAVTTTPVTSADDTVPAESPESCAPAAALAEATAPTEPLTLADAAVPTEPEALNDTAVPTEPATAIDAATPTEPVTLNDTAAPTEPATAIDAATPTEPATAIDAATPTEPVTLNDTAEPPVADEAPVTEALPDAAKQPASDEQAIEEDEATGDDEAAETVDKADPDEASTPSSGP
jgi:hypothetical protein